MKDYVTKENFKGKNVYYLNKKGRDYIGSDNEVSYSLQIDHHLMRNDLYIHFKCPKGWQIERKISFGVIGKEHFIVPDACFSKDGVWNFIEIDRVQKMVKNQEKIKYYSELSPIMEAHYKYKPVIIFYTARSSRKGKFQELCKEANLNAIIYTQEDLR
jgi:hypothetical protein